MDLISRISDGSFKYRQGILIIFFSLSFSSCASQLSAWKFYEAPRFCTMLGLAGFTDQTPFSAGSVPGCWYYVFQKQPTAFLLSCRIPFPCDGSSRDGCPMHILSCQRLVLFYLNFLDINFQLSFSFPHVEFMAHSLFSVSEYNTVICGLKRYCPSILIPL